MRAITIPEHGEADVLTIREVPDPQCGPEEVLVDVRATALNRADLLQRRGLYPHPDPQPEFDVPGLEYAGEVVSVGARVAGLSAGDRVMGILSGCGYAEKVVVHERMAIPVPDALSWQQAAAVPEAFITAHDALAQCGFRSGQSVLVHAAGSGVGVAALQIAKIGGASPVLGTAGSDEKLAAAQALGLDVPIHYKQKDFAEAAMSATGGRGVDIVVDFIGASYLERNLASLAVCGRIVVIGLLGGIAAELNLAQLLAKRAEIRGTMLRSRPLEEKAAATQRFTREVLPHIASGRIRPVIDREFSFDDIVEAHRYMETNANFGKIVVNVSA
jgi:putative PIG3 family NAD(P)H quinone oxidoreductase